MFGVWGNIAAHAANQIEAAKVFAELEKKECAEQFEKDPEGFPEWLQKREEAKARAAKAADEERRHREVVEAMRDRNSGGSAFLGGVLGFIIGSSGS